MKLISIQHIFVQDMNAVAGQVYGSVSIVSVMGYVHALERSLKNIEQFSHIKLNACAVLVHDYQLRTFYNEHYALKFLQSRNPPALYGLSNGDKSKTVPVIEEGKMNVELSLLIRYEGDIYPTIEQEFIKHIMQTSYRQRFAGGSVFNIDSVNLWQLHHNDSDKKIIRQLLRPLLPSFVLYQRSDVLAEYIKDNPNKDTLDALMDFISIKSCARPNHVLIDKHLEKMITDYPDVYQAWQEHLQEHDYHQSMPPQIVIDYFENLQHNSNKKISKANKALFDEWQNYLNPTNKTSATWSYLPKPKKGYFVPMMCGYKAISPVFYAKEIANCRSKNPEDQVCFVEAVHTLAEYKSTHRIKDYAGLAEALWYYHHEEHWYLCEQRQIDSINAEPNLVFDDYDF